MELDTTSKYRKDMKKFANNKKVKDRLKTITDTLRAGDELDPIYKNHQLTGNLRGYSECHVLPDVILIYEISNDTIRLVRIGSHSNLKLCESLKLYIREDTSCIPAKTSYMNEDGMKNGIYYFGDPKEPEDWRDVFKTKKRRKNNRDSE